MAKYRIASLAVPAVRVVTSGPDRETMLDTQASWLEQDLPSDELADMAELAAAVIDGRAPIDRHEVARANRAEIARRDAARPDPVQVPVNVKRTVQVETDLAVRSARWLPGDDVMRASAVPSAATRAALGREAGKLTQDEQRARARARKARRHNGG